MDLKPILKLHKVIKRHVNNILPTCVLASPPLNSTPAAAVRTRKHKEVTMRVTHHAPVAALSFGIAFVGSYLAISVCELYRHYRVGLSQARSSYDGAGYVIAMAVCLGGVGIWCMHFIGMSAVVLHKGPDCAWTVRYDVGLTMLSLVLVLLFSAVGVHLSSHDEVFSKSRREIIRLFAGDAPYFADPEKATVTAPNLLWLIGTHNPFYLIAGGSCAGSGIIVMHYVGMTAMHFQGTIVWDPYLIAASCIVAFLAATAAFWVLFRFLSVYPNREHLRVMCAFLMALATCSMHYIGMTAATFHPDPSVPLPSAPSMSDEVAFIAGVLAAAIVALICGMMTLSELRRSVWKLGYELNRADETMLQLPSQGDGITALQVRRYLRKRRLSAVGLGVINQTYYMDSDDDLDDVVSVESDHGESVLKTLQTRSHSAKGLGAEALARVNRRGFISPRTSFLSMQVLAGHTADVEMGSAHLPALETQKECTPEDDVAQFTSVPSRNDSGLCLV